MNARHIRQKFLDFFADKQHKIVKSAPIVNHDDPTLLFINAGMNPFKDYFLGLKDPENKRVADTQKCLRVSGKHNDLDEVGRDGYHHTMFEMLGNWSFGDYFKEEAIAWGWEFLTEVLHIDPSKLYVTIFEGDAAEGTAMDEEARQHWLKWVSPDRILPFGKKDNFWEMGATGPCGPCSEIHIDLRSKEDQNKIPAATLVNADHPEVIEIWNLVFMEYNRQDNGTLHPLPAMHVDTGMGFERLAMALQSKISSYDTDIFYPYIEALEKLTGLKYTASYATDAQVDMTFRVVADHLRAIVFALSDGLLPSNTGPGYVIRRILRRAVRYYYTFFDIHEPLIYKLVPVMADFYSDIFEEINQQKDFIASAIQQEERSFLRTLKSGLERLRALSESKSSLSGAEVFELYDTYGFPFDLTQLITAEQGIQINEQEFYQELEEQKKRSRKDAGQSIADWQILSDDTDVKFQGYDHLTLEDVRILRYRTLHGKKKNQFQIVLDQTPFYAESGGQVGDTGTLSSAKEQIKIIDTKKENDLIVHFVDRLPMEPSATFKAQVHGHRRVQITRNHSATHLLHSALREVLGNHVQQKGSLVTDDYLRFDFSHFQKMSEDELHEVENIVNDKIRSNISRIEQRNVPLREAQQSGAIMLFGEKYGDHVRIITFDPEYSKELCGGCHVKSTGEIGWFKIRSESAIGSGVRRIEALSGAQAQQYVYDKLATLQHLNDSMKNPKDPVSALKAIQEENKALQKQLNSVSQSQAQEVFKSLMSDVQTIGQHKAIVSAVDLIDPKQGKNLLFQINKKDPDIIVVLGVPSDGKAQLLIGMDKKYATSNDLNANTWIREVASTIKGGGGGQAHFASAGGSAPEGLDQALSQLRQLIQSS